MTDTECIDFFLMFFSQASLAYRYIHLAMRANSYKPSSQRASLWLSPHLGYSARSIPLQLETFTFDLVSLSRTGEQTTMQGSSNKPLIVLLSINIEIKHQIPLCSGTNSH